jgi:glucosyltransferase GtrII-like protein
MQRIKAILDFTIENKINSFIQKNLADIKLFSLLFAVILLIYGQKIFFYTLSTDDYSRYYSGGEEQASWLGRWMGGVINEHVFTGALHVLPYLNGLIGIFCFTLAGFLTAKFLKRQNTYDVCVATLLITITPFVAHNFYFNTNVSTWITTLVGVAGILMAYKANNTIKFFGFIFLIISIGTYQTIVQVTTAIIIFKAILEISETQNETEIWKRVQKTALYIALIFFAFITSSFINYLYMEYNGIPSVSHRYQAAVTVIDPYGYLGRVIDMFRLGFDLLYFKNSLHALYVLLALPSIIGLTIALFRSGRYLRINIISFIVISLLYLSIPLIINLPKITGNYIPLRAHYTMGWFLAGLFVIQMSLFSGIFRTIISAIAISIVVVSAFYINVFFDAGARQTSADILRANQIVERIRNHKAYTTEPIKFRIVGVKAFPVTGWKSDQQGLNTEWSKYALFKSFTDLQFSIMTDEEYKIDEELFVREGENFNTYPAKDSVIVYDNLAILYLSNIE